MTLDEIFLEIDSLSGVVAWVTHWERKPPLLTSEGHELKGWSVIIRHKLQAFTRSGQATAPDLKVALLEALGQYKAWKPRTPAEAKPASAPKVVLTLSDLGL